VRRLKYMADWSACYMLFYSTGYGLGAASSTYV
jgi:hypothetical protein